MAFKRFLAPTSRMAMDAVRRELGPDAVILSNKRVGDQIEILAAASHAVEQIVESEIELGSAARSQAVAKAVATRAVQPQPAQPVRRAAPLAPSAVAQRARPFAEAHGGAAMYASVASTPETDDEAVRRWKPPQWQGESVRFGPPATRAQPRRSPEAEPASEPRRAPAPVAPAPAPALASPPNVFRRRPSRLDAEDAPAARPVQQAAPQPAAVAPSAPPAPQPKPQPPAPPAGPDPRVMAELQSLRDQFSQQLAALGTSLVSTLSAAQRMPSPPVVAVASATPASAAPAPSSSAATVHVLMRLVTSGFSAALARHIAQRAPQVAELSELDAWLQQVISQNVKCVDPAQELIEAGGAFALIGPTGVGKTTTLAKIAARFAVRHGASRLGIVTLDSYRVGAHEQLRTYARILGAPVQVAHDAATLRETLAAMRGRKLVLIDTCGVSQRDERVRETLATLDGARFDEQPVKRLLLLNAALHVETLDDVAQSWRASEAAGAVLTKIDEAARCGSVLDCVIRHHMPVIGLTNGQRVPEDWHAAQAAMLAHVALKPAHGRFDLAAVDLANLGAKRAEAVQSHA